MKKKFGINSLLYIVGAVLSVAFALTTYHVTGLHEATATRFVEYGLGTLIAFWFLLNYRIAVFGHARAHR